MMSLLSEAWAGIQNLWDERAPCVVKRPQFWMIVAFVVGLGVGLVNDADAAEHQFTVGLGYGHTNSPDLISQRIGYVYLDRWGVQLEKYGGNDYEDTFSATAFRQVVFRQGKRFEPLLRLGIAYFDEPVSRDGKPLVADHLTFHLTVGLRFRGVPMLSAPHNSTAGRSVPNRGLDRGALDFFMGFPR